MSELDKINHLAHPSGPSNITRDSSRKFSLEKLIIMFFLAQFSCLKIFAMVREDCLGVFVFFTNSQNILYLLSLISSIPAFSKIWALVKSGCLAKDCHSLSSSRRSKFWTDFPLLQVPKLYFWQPLLFDDLCKAPLISLKWTFLHSITILFSV